MHKTPLVSVIIPTCNRPRSAEAAARSVLSQNFVDLEAILVNNGTKAVHQSVYQDFFSRLAEEYGSRVIVQDMGETPLGPARARNAGIAASNGKYVTFCDDDDQWLDVSYLSQLAPLLLAHQPDILFSDQRSVTEDGQLQRSTWYHDSLLGQYSTPLGTEHFFLIDLRYFYEQGGFPHLNCTLYRKALLTNHGAFDVDLSYEEDLEFFHRIASYSRELIYFHRSVSEHVIPNPVRAANASTSVTVLRQHLTRLRIFSQLFTNNENVALRRFASRSAGYAAKHLAMSAHRVGDLHLARKMSTVALGWDFGFRWAFFSIYLWIAGIARSLLVRAGFRRFLGEPPGG